MVAPTGLCENYHSRVTLSGAETFKERSREHPLVGRGLVSRRFGSVKSVCNGGTKAPPYNAPLTHLRWELPPRGASRKNCPEGKMQ